ncbi:MAG: hypothetical protein QGH13_02520 [Candidatus Thalassarchaeaceae archaeon]|jgi:hypothetical protein|nr:hypothetical protein [Candidatus Thalassarchaeaceae archaeon]
MVESESSPLSIKWDDDAEEVISSLISIPSRPQPGILKIVGSLMMIGGFLVLTSGILGFVSSGEIDPSFFQDQANQINAAGDNVTVEEVQQFYESTERYAGIQRFLEVFGGLGLIIGGYLIFTQMSLGIKIGLGGGGLVILDSILITLGVNGVESESFFLTASGYMLQGLMTMCGLFCTILPILPLLFTGAKAALDPDSNKSRAEAVSNFESE